MPGFLISLLFIGYPLSRKKIATLLCPKYKRIFARLIKSFVSLVRWRSFLWHLSPLLFPDEPRLSGWVGLVSVLISGRQYQARINIMESHPRSHKAGVVWGLPGPGSSALLNWGLLHFRGWPWMEWPAYKGCLNSDSLSPRSQQAVRAKLACAAELGVQHTRHINTADDVIAHIPLAETNPTVVWVGADRPVIWQRA